MCSWQDVNLGIQRTDFINLTTVRTHFIFNDQAAHLVCLNTVADLFYLLEHLCLCGFVFIFLSIKNSDSFLCQLVNFAIAFQLLFDGYRITDCLFKLCTYLAVDVLVHGIQLNLHLFFSNGCCDFLLEGNQLLNVLMTEHDSTQHCFLANFLRTGLYHIYGILCTGNRQVDITLLQLLRSRVDDVFAIHASYHYTGNRTVERDVGNAQCQGCPKHCGHFRCTVLIYG